MLLIRLALSCFLPHGFPSYSALTVPKLFPSFDRELTKIPV